VYCGCEILIRDLHWIRSIPASQKNAIRFRKSEEGLQDLLELLLEMLRLYPSARACCLHLHQIPSCLNSFLIALLSMQNQSKRSCTISSLAKELTKPSNAQDWFLDRGPYSFISSCHIPPLTHHIITLCIPSPQPFFGGVTSILVIAPIIIYCTLR
jgi:hypothetical protein